MDMTTQTDDTVIDLTDDTSDDTVIDLTDPGFLDALMEERHARRFDEAHIVEWLRSSGGSLTDRMMKHRAADAIERSAARSSQLPV